MEVVISPVDEAEVDARWSGVGQKKAHRWLWHAIDYRTEQVLADVCGRRKADVLLQWQALLEPVGLMRDHPDSWGAYQRHLTPEVYHPGKRNAQRIARQQLTLRARITRLARKTICFAKLMEMHDIVLGLCRHRYGFGLPV